jgi:hypothetical protein
MTDGAFDSDDGSRSESHGFISDSDHGSRSESPVGRPSPQSLNRAANSSRSSAAGMSATPACARWRRRAPLSRRSCSAAAPSYPTLRYARTLHPEPMRRELRHSCTHAFRFDMRCGDCAALVSTMQHSLQLCNTRCDYATLVAAFSALRLGVARSTLVTLGPHCFRGVSAWASTAPSCANWR